MAGHKCPVAAASWPPGGPSRIAGRPVGAPRGSDWRFASLRDADACLERNAEPVHRVPSARAREPRCVFVTKNGIESTRTRRPAHAHWCRFRRNPGTDLAGDQRTDDTGRVRISTVIGHIAPDARLHVAAILNDWNQDATGAVGIMTPSVAILVIQTNHSLVAQVAVGFMLRQAAHATTLARYLLSEGLVERQQVSLAQQRHRLFGVRENPDELVRLYSDAVHDGGDSAEYDTSAVHE